MKKSLNKSLFKTSLKISAVTSLFTSGIILGIALTGSYSNDNHEGRTTTTLSDNEALRVQQVDLIGMYEDGLLLHADSLIESVDYHSNDVTARIASLKSQLKTGQVTTGEVIDGVTISVGTIDEDEAELIRNKLSELEEQRGTLNIALLEVKAYASRSESVKTIAMSDKKGVQGE